MLRIAGLPVYGPSDVIAGTRAVLGWTDDAVGLVAALPERITTLLDDVDALVARVGTAVDRIEALAERTDGVVNEAAGMVRRIDPLLTEVRTTVDGAAGLVDHAGDVAAGAAMLVARADGVAGDAASLVGRAHGVADDAAGIVAEATAVTGRADVVITDAGRACAVATELLDLYEPMARHAAPLATRFVDELSEEEVDAAIRLVDQVPQFTEHMITDVMPILATLDRVGPDVHELLDVLKDVRMAIQGVPGFKLLRRRGEREEG